MLINIRINNIDIQVEKGTKILQAAKQLHIDIPHLCYHPDQDIKARCRICSVEVKGQRRLLAACSTECWEGMEIFTDTKIVRDTQRSLLQLIMADHVENCLTCPRNSNCVLQDLCSRFNILRPNVDYVAKHQDPISDNPSLVHDREKCVKCGRCIRACKEVQGIEVLGFSGRSTDIKVSTPFSDGFSNSECVLCGQCSLVCPVGSLVEKDDTEKVLEAIYDPNKTVIVQTAPSVRIALGDAFGLESGSIVTSKMITALRLIGFDKVFDTNYGADLTITEEANELLERLEKNKNLPMATSCCPGWVNYVEKHYPDLINHLSTTKSPMQIFSAVNKTHFAKENNLDPKNIFMVAIMPCIAKKYEAQREEMGREGYRDTDAVITTRGLIKLIKYIGIDFNSLEDGKFDNPMGEATGAAAIFGTTGGVMEAALRTSYEWATGKELKNVEFDDVRGFDGIREATVDINGRILKLAVVHTLRNAKIVMDEIRQGKSKYDFIEVMACPGGCLGGGGQPVNTNMEINAKRRDALYTIDKNTKYRKSHENPYLIKLYKQFLGSPGKDKAHELLHTHYCARDKIYSFEDKKDA